MFSYYGAKTKLIDLYPAPRFDKIIEPFAGSARYALKYFERDVLLVDKWDVIVNIWKYLQQASPSDIIGLPRPEYLDNLNNFDISQVERDFLGFVVGAGAERPRQVVGYRKTRDRPNHVNYTLKRISENLYKIRHWHINLGSYEDIRSETCTWFVDPPYQHGGDKYAMSNRRIDFSHLAGWCRQLDGQVIVCENTKADWLPFMPMKSHRGSRFVTTEAIYTNELTQYNNVQQKLLL